MEKLKGYKNKIRLGLVAFLAALVFYYIGKTMDNLGLSIFLFALLIGGIGLFYRRFSENIKSLKNDYGDMAIGLYKQVLQRANSLFIGLYGLVFLLSVNLGIYLNYFPFDELSPTGFGIFRAFIEFIIGFSLMLCARLSFDRQKRFIKILYPLLVFTGLYLLVLGDGIVALMPLVLIAFLTYITREALIKESFVYSVEELFIDLVFGLLFILIYLKNLAKTQPIRGLSTGYSLIFFISLVLSGILVLKLILVFMKRPGPMSKKPDMDVFKDFLKENGTDSNIAGLGLLNDKYIYYYEDEEGKKLVAFLYQIVNNKLIVMGEPFGASEYKREALDKFLEDSYRFSLNPVFYEVSQDFTLELHDYGFDFMKFGENALIDLEAFSLAGRKKSSLRNILNRFKKDGYEFKLVDPPYDDKLIEKLRVISDKWLHGRQEKGFSLGFFDKDYLNESKLALAYDSEGEICAFVNIMPNYNEETITIDLMRYDPDREVNSMMDYLFLNLFIYAKDSGIKYFNLGMAPLANVGINKSAYLSERIASLVYAHAGSIYPFKGLKNFKSKYASSWEPRYICFAKGNFILSSMAAIMAADKGVFKED